MVEWTIKQDMDEALAGNYEFVDYRPENKGKEREIITAREIEPEMLHVILQNDRVQTSWMCHTILDYADAGLSERVRIAVDFSNAFTDFLFEGI